MCQSIIPYFRNYLLLNACSVHSPGLNNGKAGISLCLFEISRYFNDETIEEYAFELLQESLALSGKSENIHFEEGLAGIGFVLLYLIENQFLDADFEELFGEQLNRIRFCLEKQANFSEKDLSFMCFEVLLSGFGEKMKQSMPVYEILKGNERILQKRLESFDLLHSVGIKYEVRRHLESCLKIASLCTKYNISSSLIHTYIRLYGRGRVAGNFSTGYYLEKLVIREEEKRIVDTIKNNAVQNIHPETLSLAQRIDLLYLLNQDKQCFQNTIDRLEEELFDIGNPYYESHLIWSVSNQGLLAGYGSGIARLLLYWVYRENRRKEMDCSRFKYLF